MRRLTACLLFLFGIAAPCAAQESTASFAFAGAPRFLSGIAPDAKVIQPASVPALQRRVTLGEGESTLGQALDAITQQTGIHFVFSSDVITAGTPVRVDANGLSLAATLTELLLNAKVDVAVLSPTQLALLKRHIPAEPGTIVGTVTDASTGRPLMSAQVWVDGMRQNTLSDEAGKYRLQNVPAGPRKVGTSLIGYKRMMQEVSVGDGATVTLDFAMQVSPTPLTQIVVTATGEQRRVDLGHVVGRINADSLVRAAPISTVSELLTARVPGLQVYQTQGSVGGRVNLQNRGPNSISVSNEPIVIIDGVRYTTGERSLRVGPFANAVPGNTELTSPLNDLNPNDIESVEVVKGPSAATLYGTDAANGVIVITTKRGRPGPARWNAYGRWAVTETPTDRIPDIYWGWGTVSGVPNNPNVSCTLNRLASGQCTQQDSVTVLPSVLRNPEYSVITAKPTSQYGVNMSGGSQDLRYYFAADFTDAVGPVQMPTVFANRLKERLGVTKLPKEWREPNSLTNLNLRSNVSAVLGRTAEVNINSAYIKSSTNSATFANNPYERGINRTTPANPIGYSPGATPEEAFARQSTDDVDRFVGSTAVVWRPAPWLSTRAVLGLDVIGVRKYALAEPGNQPSNFASGLGAVEDTRSRQVATTADVGISAKAQRGRLNARTSVGVQYAHAVYDASGSLGTGLAPGQSVVPGAITIFHNAFYSESAVLGGFVEEMLGLNDRLFLSAAARMDGASTFGRNFQATVYPKVGASWLVTAEPFMPQVPGLDELRVRAAFGASGRQPDPTWVRPRFDVAQTTLDGQQQNAYRLGDLGNPDLRPERTREFEFGVDIGAFEHRFTLETTWYSRRTTDQLISVAGPPGFGSRRENLGLTTQYGFEAKIDARVLDTRAVSFDIGLLHSNYTTKLVDLGGGQEPLPGNLYQGGYREGYPLGGSFAQPILGWNDLNGDGILVFNELVLGDTVVYMGQSFPPQTQTLSAVLGLLGRRVRVSTLLERKSGFTHVDPFTCFNDTCRALVDPNASFEEQANAILIRDTPQSADFVRLREVALALDVPQRFLTPVRLSRATLVLSGRNLALWSKFGGTDPEVNGAFNGSISTIGAGQAFGIPLGRVLSVRLDLGL